jgi:hypothetical protein
MLVPKVAPYQWYEQLANPKKQKGLSYMAAYRCHYAETEDSNVELKVEDYSYCRSIGVPAS